VRAQPSRVLKFVPQADLSILDPIFSIAIVTRNHGYDLGDAPHSHGTGRSEP
jgi:peptide/nickel transport system substrate-binding protein